MRTAPSSALRCRPRGSAGPSAVLAVATLAVATLAGTGCQDYQLYQLKDEPGAEDTAGTFAPLVDIEENGALDDTAGELALVVPSVGAANASINVILQYSSFGNAAQGCSFDVAFYPLTGDDGYGSGGTAQTINMPADPGTCAFTLFDPDDTGTGGSMTVRGTVDAGAELHAYNESYDITLTRQESDDGSLRYRWEGCDRSVFPFAQALSLSGSGEEGGIDAFDLPDVIAVGPDVIQTYPTDSDLDLGVLPLSLAQPFDWQWDWSAAFPSTAEGPVTVAQMFMIRNARTSDNRMLEALACKPAEDGGLTVDPEDLGQLSPDPGDGSTYAGAQLDTYFYGATADAPWGQTLRAQSLISMSGLLRLSP